MKHSRQPTNVQFLYVSNGTFYARTYSVGRERWVSLRTKVKPIARKKLAQLLASHHDTGRARRDIESGSATVGQLASLYLEMQLLRTDLRASSKKNKGSVVRSILTTWPGLADKLPSRVSEHEVAEWAARHHRDKSSTLHNASIDSLRGIFAIAIDRGIIGTNPAAKLVKATVRRKRLELPSSEQLREIVQTVRTTGSAFAVGNGDLIEFMAYSGARIGEAGRVKWKDVDEASGRIWIEPGKSEHGRHIPINPSMADLLKRILDGKSWSKRVSRRGYVMINKTCDGSLKAACAKVGVQKMTHHKLRHWFATKCLENGVPVSTLAVWLGHADGGVTLLKTYAHLLDRHSQESAARLKF
jgi:integrase